MAEKIAAPGVSPMMDITLQSVQLSPRRGPFDPRVIFLCVLATALGLVAAGVAQVLVSLIGLVTNLAYYGRWSLDFVSPADHRLGLWAVAIPVVGGLVVGLMARFGSKAIRGHGIPEAMEQVLTNESRIPARMTILKPLSAAVAIGSGGPFGAEGPVIATGGALGSLLGQVLSTTADERKVLLASGAAAGMAATFGSPVASVLLAVELLLFEFRARSMVPVALAAVTATAVRVAIQGSGAAFAVPPLPAAGGLAVLLYTLSGVLIGFLAVGVVWAVYAVEDAFEHLPVHWMWWPAVGGLAVGLVGLVAPHTLGVGYDNIEKALSGELVGPALAFLVGCKLLSWLIALGSGTSGGTLAPLFTVGGGLGALLGTWLTQLFPGAGLDPRMTALVGMAAIFAASSRALLASVVFAFETTHQTSAVLPLLGGCTAAYLVAYMTQRNTIMTEKLIRRGTIVPGEYIADFLAQLWVKDVATRPVVTLKAEETVSSVQTRLAKELALGGHQGYPVTDHEERLVGVVTRRDLQGHGPQKTLGELVRRPVWVAFEDSSLREAVDTMVAHEIGRLPVVDRSQPHRVTAILTRGDVLAAQRRPFDAAHERARTFKTT